MDYRYLILILLTYIIMCIFLQKKHKGIFIQMTGLSGAGKSTLANLVSEELKSKGYNVEIIDGDIYRENLCSDLGFSKEDRNINIKRLSFVGKLLAKNDVIVIMAAINPYDEIRKNTRDENTKLVYIKTSLNTVKTRDVKGLYERAYLPQDDPNHIPNFTGVSDPYEPPEKPDLIINTERQDVRTSARILKSFIISNI